MKNKTFTVASYEVRKTFRRKAFLFITIVIPLLFVTAVFFAIPVLPSILGGLGGIVGIEDQNIGYVDSFGFLEPSEGFLEFPDEESARQVLAEENISSFFVLSDSYFEDGNITFYITGATVFNKPWNEIGHFLRINLMDYWNVSEEMADKIVSPFDAKVVKLEGGGAVGSSAAGLLEFALPYGFAILLLIAIMMSSSYLMQGIGEEKENRTGELLLSSISADQLLRGKILGYGSLGLFQTGMYALAGILVISISPLAPMFAGLQMTGLIGIGIIYLLMGYALFASSIAATASISSSAKEAQQTSSLFTVMAIIPLALITFIIRDPNSAFAQALTYIPYTSPFVVMMRMSLTNVPLYEIVISLIILAVSIVVVSKLAGKIFRMGMLKYDRRASLREILGFLREK